MVLRSCFFLFSIVFFPLSLYAQEELDFERVVEEVFTVQDDEVDYDAVYEYLYQLYANPLNLNTATEEDLLSVYLLSDRQVNNLLKYREQYGDFISIYELQFIPGFDKPTITHLLPFIIVEATGQERKSPFSQRIAMAENRLWLLRYTSDLEPKRGYLMADTISDASERSYYKGSPNQLYTRLRVNSRNDFSFGITAERDAGEPLAWAPRAQQYGMDFWSFHAHLEDKGRLKDLVIGDYTLRFGQGLVLGSGFSMGKGAETVQTVRFRDQGIRPYTSAAETGFFRGLASTYQIPLHQSEVEITAFYSNLHQDGKVQVDTLNDRQVFSSISASGFHRTPGELGAKNKLNEQALGTHIQYNHAANNFHAGVLYVRTHFNAYWQKPSHLYNLYEFAGKRNDNLGGHVDYSMGHVSLFGEAARSGSGGIGALAGLTAYVSSQVSMAWLIRNYDKDFHAFYGHAFGENTRNINEKGMYWGLKLHPIQRTTLSAYYDYFRFPWMRYRVEAPSRGYEYLLRLDHELTRRTRMFVQFREESKEVNTDDIFPRILPGIKRGLALNLRHEINDVISIRTRIQNSQYQLKEEISRGSVVAQDITFNLGKLKVDARYALFRTDDYQNRQYLYENDVLYSFSIPAYDGTGTKSYLLLRYKINPSLQCWLRAARTCYDDRDEIGSGLETIEGPIRTNIKCQLLVKL